MGNCVPKHMFKFLILNNKRTFYTADVHYVDVPYNNINWYIPTNGCLFIFVILLCFVSCFAYLLDFKPFLLLFYSYHFDYFFWVYSIISNSAKKLSFNMEYTVILFPWNNPFLQFEF